jgi:hypothetical protein
MRNFFTTISSDKLKLIVHLKDYSSLQTYLNFVFNNAKKLPVTKDMSNTKSASLEEIIKVSYYLGYKHGQDFMDGKRPQDNQKDDIKTVYTAYEEE